jgi:hypothetical protein
MYPSTFGHVVTCVCMNYRPNESPSFQSRRGSSTCAWEACGEKTSGKNLGQRIDIKLCVEIGKGASGMLALLVWVYGEYTVKKLLSLYDIGC